MRRTSLLLSCVVVAACAGTAPAPSTTTPDKPAPGTEPKLVVLLVVDQWPEWAFEAKRGALTGGFDRLLREGTWHVGQHPSAATITAPGHALLGTGEPASRSGILANEWYHRDLERMLKSVESADGAPTAAWLRVPGLGDALAAANRGGKALSVSLKDRAAILPLGHSGTAIWYDPRELAWRGMTQRAGAVGPAPDWLAAWNTARPIRAHIHDAWTPLEQAAKLAGIPDDAPGEIGVKGFGPTFPHALDATKRPADAIYAMPLGNDLVLDTASEAIAREQLGQDDRADFLSISLSAHDYIGHGWGQESWESWDAILRLDRRLDQFLADLDAKVGAGRWAMIVTSDHGASPMPDPRRGGRITYAQVKEAANRAAIAELGPGEWIAAARYPTVYLSKAALAQKPKDLAIATRKIIFALRSFPGLARVALASQLTGRCDTRAGDARLICLALDPERSGEIFYMPAPGWILHDAPDDPAATSHGSLHPYDRQVPVIVLAPGRKAHAALAHPDDTSFPIERVAPTLATWLGVPAPTSLPR